MLLEKLRNAELDMIIIALPLESSEFDEVELYAEDFWLAVPQHDPLAKLKQVSFFDLNTQEMLLLEEGHCLRGQALDVCFNAGATEHGRFRATSLETLRQMVNEGIGMTLIPKLAVPENSDRIRYLPFKDPKPSRTIRVLFRKNSVRKTLFQQMASIINSKIS